MHKPITVMTSSTCQPVTTASIAETMAKFQELMKKAPKRQVILVSTELFNDLTPEDQELYLSLGNHVADVPGRIALDVTRLMDGFENSLAGIVSEK